MIHRFATIADVPLLAELNHQLIRDEGHRNTMSLGELSDRMQAWLETREYAAALFEETGEVFAYALYREQPAEIHLRQFFVVRHRRRTNLGRQALRLLSDEVWPKTKRITVDVLAGNVPALAFYRSLGYLDYAITLEIVPPPARVA